MSARIAHQCARCLAGIDEDEVSLRASSLAFSVIFCAAPLVAMALSLAALFPHALGFLPSLYETLGSRVLPHALDDAIEALSAFAVNAAHLSVASLALSLTGAYSLSVQVERCARACWGPRPEPPRGVALALRHAAALMSAPLALAGLGWAAAMSGTRLWGLGGVALSAAGLFAFFLLCSWGLPRSRPPLRVAAVACALACAQCLLLQAAFGWVWALARDYGTIYGAAAVFLAALLWIWLFWLSFLSSLSICSTLLLGRPRDLDAYGLGWAERWAPPAAVDPLEPPPTCQPKPADAIMPAQAKPLANQEGAPSMAPSIAASPEPPPP